MHIWVANLLSDVAQSAGIKGHQASKEWVGTPKELWSALHDGKVDVVTLAVYKHPSQLIEKCAQDGLAGNPNIRVTIQEMWLPADGQWPGEPKNPWHSSKEDFDKSTGDFLRKLHEPYFKEFDDNVRAVNKKLGKQVVFVVPVGQAAIALREKVIAGQVPGIEKQSDLFADGGGHPNAQLQALTAYCHFAVIYRRSPVGLPVPTGLMKTEVATKDTEKLNRLLQKLAWDAVIHHPLSGVRTDAAILPSAGRQ